MKKKINILFLIDYFHVAGGTETHLTYLVTGLDKKKYNCFIVVFDFGESTLSQKIKEAGVQIFHLPVGRFYTFNAIKQALILAKLIKVLKIDIVQTYHIKSDTYGVLIAKLAGIKRIISSKRDTGDLKTRLHYLLNWLINPFIKGYIAVCDAVGDVVSKREHIKRNKFRTIYNGVDFSKFMIASEKDKIEQRKKLGIDISDFVIGVVSWLRPEKGYDVFFKALKEINNQVNNFKVVIVGGGFLLNHYKEFSKAIGLNDKVIFIGPTENVSDYIRIFDVACLFPIRNEGFSNAILEKMAMSLPIVVTDIGGNRESVKDGYNGIVIQANNHKALSNALIYLYQNPDERASMGKNSKKRVMDMFTLGKMIENHENYYEKFYRQHSP